MARCAASATPSWTISELRTALDQIPGKKIVMLDSCHSGQAIGKSKSLSLSGDPTLEMMKAFNSSVISQFSAADKAAMSRSNLATNNYYVMTACRSDQTSLSVGTTNGKSVGLFTYVMLFGNGWNEVSNGAIAQLHADNNGDNRITLHEAYSFTTSQLAELRRQNPRMDQLTQVYPTSSSFVLWGK